MKYFLHNSTLDKARVVIIGVPDESGSRSKRAKGVARAPNYIRKVSNEEDSFGEGRKAHSQTGIIKEKVFDLGNIKKKSLRKKACELISAGKIPIILGGDHSVTTEVIKGINEKMKNISFVYFDAHPDFRCSDEEYYGSVVCDITKLKNINIKKSAEIGVRVPEESEIKNIKSNHLLTFTPYDIQELGVKKVFEEIKKRVKGSNGIYLSIDMDVIDPAFAPGVDTPVPGGLSSSQFIYLAKKIAKLGLIGIDITEVNPKYDRQKMTGHLASRIIAEIIKSLR